MSALFRIVRAAHANGTHHKLALDALTLLRIGAREQWQKVFLKHAGLYMQGAKAPDDEFKDFKNHVLHPRDGYWGGAPEKVAAWYGHLITALKEQKWSEAAYCAGVMSHYFTDPIHPFHTAQSEAENNIHRAAEWSINRGYDALFAEGQAAHPHMTVSVPDSPHWLKDLVCAGADRSNAQYEKLIAHYDINTGVVDPPSGLDPIARRLVGELLVYATTSFAYVLDRAIAESGVAAPDLSLTLETVIAAIKIPLKMLQKKLTDTADRRLVEAMYDELKATGRVEQNLPQDDRMVRELHAKEVLAKCEPARTAERAHRVAQTGTPKSAVTKQRATAGTAIVPAALVSHENVARVPIERPAVAAIAPANAAPAPAPQTVVVAPVAREGLVDPVPLESYLSSLRRMPRIHLRATDDIEAAPSIGPKMAERLAMGGLKTVADLLAADAEATALTLGDRRITGEGIRDWQDQARLVMSVPGLRGTHAQLLVGAGYRSAEAIAMADASKLSADLLTFAVTGDGQRILRDGNPPEIEAIHGWIAAATEAKAA